MPESASGRAGRGGPSARVDACGISHSFQRPALNDVDLHVAAGEIHALLGPNGAGKTTLLRVLAGLQRPDGGALTIAGSDGIRDPKRIRQHVGLMPSGDGTLYPRISGLENLAFFGRLQGFRRKDAVTRAHDLLELVGLAEHAHKHVRAYSHGMQKRLSFARSLLAEPSVLLIDEATHDLDPAAARVVRDLTRRAASGGTAVVWTTQRLDEVRGFADGVTVLSNGSVCFSGSVQQLIGHAMPTRYLLSLQNGGAPPAVLVRTLERVLAPAATISSAPHAPEEDYVLSLEQGHVIGDVLLALDRAGVRILSCREERSGVEDAFLALTGRST